MIMRGMRISLENFQSKLKEDTDSINLNFSKLKIKENNKIIFSESQLNAINISDSYYSSIEIPSEDDSLIQSHEYMYFIEQSEIYNIITNKKEKNNIQNSNYPININNVNELENNNKLAKDISTNKKEKDNNNENNDNKKDIKNNFNNNFRKYINEEMYPVVRNHLNINPSNFNIVDVIGDGNCLFRSIARFVFGDENMHARVRKEIYEYAYNRIHEYPDLTLNIEEGPMNIRKYINNINRNGFYGGKLEIGIAAILYNINIATYNEIRDNNNIIRLNPINYYSNNNDNNEQRHLLILTNNRD